MKTRFCFSGIVQRLLEQEYTFEAIAFGFVPPCSSFIHDRQCFREHCEPCLWLPYGSLCFGEEREPIRSEYLCPCRRIGSDALLELLDPFLPLPLVRQ